MYPCTFFGASAAHKGLSQAFLFCELEFELIVLVFYNFDDHVEALVLSVS